MIRALRRRHRFAALCLALALPPALAVALVVRTPQASAPESRPELSLTPSRAADGARAVEIDSRGAPVVPDALAYFSPEPAPRDAVTADSVFLGEVPADALRSYALPGRAAGRVLVYSLAWGRVVASLEVTP